MDARAPTGVPATLRIRFGAGERPHMFWISPWTQQPEGRCRYKILSKSRRDRTLQVLVVLEDTGRRRDTVASVDVPADSPSGWLQHWVETLASELGTRFESYDLRGVEDIEEWSALARRLGWTRGG